MAGKYSYWGMNPESEAEYEGKRGLAGAAKQRYDELTLAATDRMEEAASWSDFPTLEELRANQGEDSQRADIMSDPEAGNEVLTTIVDWMNPLPISGLGTIVRSKVGPTLERAQEMARKGAHPQEIVAETGQYMDRAGNWKTQIPDDKAVVAEHEVRKAARMSPLEVKKAKTAEPSRNLANVLKHDELFMEKPWLASKGQVKYTDEVKVGAMRPKFSEDGELLKLEILINPKGVREYANSRGKSFDDTMKTVLVHEVNHGVQVLDDLPGGNSAAWIEKVRKQAPVLKKELAEYQETLRQMPKTAPRAQELQKKVTAIKSQLELFEGATNMKSDALYRHTLGEADSFWVQSMMDDPFVKGKLPSHERPENPVIKEEGLEIPFQEHLASVTKPGQHSRMFKPEAEQSIREAGGLREVRRPQQIAASEIDAGHTSPASFTKFDSNYAFTGEGAQGFGAGHYLWTNPKVGQHYKKMFDDRLRSDIGQLEGQIRAFEQQLNQPRGVTNDQARTMRSKIADLRETIKAKDKTHVYDVEIPNKYKSQIGDWDAALSQQPARIQGRLRKLAQQYFDEPAEVIDNLSLQEIYREVAKASSQETASKMMQKAGMVGHKFFDGESRGLEKIMGYVNEHGTEKGIDLYIQRLQQGPLRDHDFSGLKKDLRKMLQEATHNYVIYDDAVPIMRGSRVDID